MKKCWLRTASALIVGIVVLAGASSASAAKAPSPTITGPVTGGAGMPRILSSSFDLADVGYEGNEYFLAGTAKAYTSATPLASNGKWKVTPATGTNATADYKTRVVVYRPQAAKDFNGTVIVEWLNVSAGFDSAPDWGLAHRELIRAGSAWVGVSAQSVGVQGGSMTIAGAAPGGLKGGDPERYASLVHPGDSYSYDMFTQVGRAVKGTKKTDPLSGLKAKKVIAIGESQSAFRMVTYIDGIQPIEKVFDGFFVHSRSNGAANLSQAPLPVITPEAPTFIRNDLGVPVMTLQTESDLVLPRLEYLSARQKDTKNFRLWEVAGTSHADAYTGGIGFSDTGDGKAEAALLDVANADGGPLGCTQPINYGPHFSVVSAALHALTNWVADGTAPPRAPRLEVTAGPPATITRDATGNAQGGIRTPLVDAPTAVLRGDGNAGASFCQLFGSTLALNDEQLAALYPSHKAYVAAFTKSANKAVRDGFMLKPEAKNFIAAAKASNVGG